MNMDHIVDHACSYCPEGAVVRVTVKRGHDRTQVFDKQACAQHKPRALLEAEKKMGGGFAVTSISRLSEED